MRWLELNRTEWSFLLLCRNYNRFAKNTCQRSSDMKPVRTIERKDGKNLRNQWLNSNDNRLGLLLYFSICLPIFVKRTGEGRSDANPQTSQTSEA